jgi:hypothetical protein
MFCILRGQINLNGLYRRGIMLFSSLKEGRFSQSGENHPCAVRRGLSSPLFP